MHSGDAKDGGEGRAGDPDEVVYLRLDSIDADVKHIVGGASPARLLLLREIGANTVWVIGFAHRIVTL